ncbi:MAG TPA: spore coat protein U domain-containing protein [Caldimonas sp.]|jgi:spore coat protein U-like protein
MQHTGHLASAPRTRSRQRCVAGAIVAGALLAAAESRADSCSVSAATHAFGAYDTINAKPGTSAITVTCTHTNSPAVRFNYSIALSIGPGSYAGRQMVGTGDTLVYNLYTSVAHTTVWGDGTSGSAVVAGSFNVPGGAGRSGSDVQTVFGLIGAPQNVLPGSYATASPITVTVTY